MGHEMGGNGWGDRNLELLDGDVQVKPSLRSRVWRDYENIDDAGHGLWSV